MAGACMCVAVPSLCAVEGELFICETRKCVSTKITVTRNATPQSRLRENESIASAILKKKNMSLHKTKKQHLIRKSYLLTCGEILHASNKFVKRFGKKIKSWTIYFRVLKSLYNCENILRRI